jgi:hypothetical protein
VAASSSDKKLAGLRPDTSGEGGLVPTLASDALVWDELLVNLPRRQPGHEPRHEVKIAVSRRCLPCWRPRPAPPMPLQRCS